MSENAPTASIDALDWQTDFDHTTQAWAQNAPQIWEQLREACPVAHTERFGGAWYPTRFEDVAAIAYDTEHFSSVGVVVSPVPPAEEPGLGAAPPITSDPPVHKDARRLLLPAFSPKAIDKLEDTTRDTCRELIDKIKAKIQQNPDAPGVDAAVDYAQHIPVRIIAKMLGLPPEDGDKFRVFIHRILEAPGQEDNVDPNESLDYYLNLAIEKARSHPSDNLMSYLVELRVDGEPLSEEHIRGTCALLLIAGIDTTWSAIGASLWHLAQNPGDRHRLATEPDLMVLGMEELLRAYAPVTMARRVVKDVEVGGCPMSKDEWVLLPFPAANRDPEQFDDADQVIIDRAQNRHSAFGLGIHRCAGSNLARMELRIALEEWLAAFPDYELTDPQGVRWSTGQVRGPRELPVTIL